MSGQNVGEAANETPGIWLSADEVDFITGILVELPFKVAAPIIQLLGQKLIEARSGG